MTPPPTQDEPIDTIVVDGLALANQLRDEMAKEIESLAAGGHRPPQLTVVLVGDDPASKSYIKGKQRACARIGARPASPPEAYFPGENR
jgi:5,10-methylene-tetrahydrofolate dehydrogenase/methenyl tetrahydrofolate cyclohydrolase